MKYNTIFPILLIILLSWWAVNPLVYPGFFPIHDSTHLARIDQMVKALKEGQFPARWVPDLGYGYGYPLYNFYAPLPYYVGALFNIIGFDILTATKLIIGLSIILSGIFMFFLVKEIFFEKWLGIYASILYIYAPYRALDTYVRGAVGELWAMTFLPLVTLGFYKIIITSLAQGADTVEKNSKFKIRNSKLQLKVQNWPLKWMLVGSIGLASVILSHNITGMLSVIGLGLFIIIWFVYSLLSKKELLTSYFLLLTSLIGLGLSSFFWLPAIVELPSTSIVKLTRAGSYFGDHFVYPDQLWSSPWGFAGSAPGRLDGMSFTIGKVHVLSAFASLVVVYFHRKEKRYHILCSVFVLLTTVSLLLTLEVSKPMWQMLPFFSFIQFPWRFLLFATFGLSIAASLFLLIFPRYLKFFGFALLSLAVIFYNSRYFKPQEHLMVTEENYTNQLALQWETSRIFDEYMPPDFLTPNTVDEIRMNLLIKAEDITIFDKHKSATKLFLKIESPEDQLIELYIALFPGWRIQVNGQDKEYFSKLGRIAFPISKGKSEIRAFLTDTPIRKLANITSLSWFIFLFYLLYAQRKETH